MASSLALLLLVLLSASGSFLPCRCQEDGGGRWRVLRSVGISAMHMQLLRNDGAVMFDRTDFGRSNLSLPPGRCRRDPLDTALKVDCTAHSVLYDLPSNAVLPLTVLTDTWCSSGAVLPDGSLLQSGGFNDGDRVVRSLSACPFPVHGDGANDTAAVSSSCDWVERPAYLAARRWYATNQILPDGRIIIIGGRKQFNYEFFPREGDSRRPPLVEFWFLRQTRDGETENNLYPFVHLLPDGNLFVFANTRAVLLDYTNNRVVRTFPPIPGDDPRNYPSSGSSVLLPLRLADGSSSSVEAEVLICGGAPRGSYELAQKGTFLPALTTCGRLVVTDPGAAWRMETMPMARVMSDMLLLPTAEVLVINGAGRGTAGWELARSPVTSPLLYRPDDLPGRRFSALKPSAIPRMYHSTAVVDTYGRVLVGGSNPHVYYEFADDQEFPTELRLEAFYPPYLDSSLDALRPAVLGVAPPDRSVAYGQPVTVRFGMRDPVGPRGNISVVLLAPPFATHGLSMNQRLLILPVGSVERAAAPSEYRATATAPATARVAPPGYYLMFVVCAKVPSKGVWVRIH